MESIKVAFMGAPEVGKSSIIQKYISGESYNSCLSKPKRNIYYPGVLINDRLFYMKIVDVPSAVSIFSSSHNSCNNFQCCGLQDVLIYVLVFDVYSLNTFNFIKSIKEQLCTSRSHLSMAFLIVGNKIDLLEDLSSLHNTQPYREIISLIKKWKCPYVECSAKFNWHVVNVFTELIKLSGAVHSEMKGVFQHSPQRSVEQNSRCCLFF